MKHSKIKIKTEKSQLIEKEILNKNNSKNERKYEKKECNENIKITKILKKKIFTDTNAFLDMPQLSQTNCHLAVSDWYCVT